jgi:hypothetical protein
MKQLFLFTALILMSLPFLAQEQTNGIVIQTRELAPFDQLRVSRGINVTLVEGENPKAEIHIENTDPEDVIIEQKNKVLTIRMRTRIYRDVAVNVYLTYQTIREISAGTGGSVYSEDVLEGDQLKLEAGADASIQLEVEVNKIVANASTARIELTGSADYIDVNVSTGGRFLGANLESREGNVRANTGANAQVWVTEKLEARAGSGARVEYTGDPSKLEVRTSLGGRVEVME